VGDLVTLKCRAETLTALATGLTRFGPTQGEPEWLVSGVWLCVGDAHYLATASVEVLADGYVARPLDIAPTDELADRLEAELPDVSARLVGRGNAFELPRAGDRPMPPKSLSTWHNGPYSTSVLLRVSERVSSVHQVECALLFVGGNRRSLLVGTDPSTLAMVISEDEALIERYGASCKRLPLKDYLERAGS
jgi:hypothetical protein